MVGACEDAVENAGDLRKLLIFSDNVKIYRTKMQMHEIYACDIIIIIGGEEEKNQRRQKEIKELRKEKTNAVIIIIIKINEMIDIILPIFFNS